MWAKLRDLVVACLFCTLVGCSAMLPPPLPIPPRPPTSAMAVGITFSPFTQAEWDHFTWSPLWRVEIDQAADAITHHGQVLLLTRTLDDSSIDEMIPFLPQAWGIELGNEPNFSLDATQVNLWYLKTITRLRAAGYTGRILTASIGNLDTNTLQWLMTSIKNLPPDIIIGWHGYSNWETQIPQLLGVIGNHPQAMTETGQPNTGTTEEAIYEIAQRQAKLVFDSGSLTFIWYQMHDGPAGTSLSDWGIHTLDDRWRKVEHALIEAP